MSAGKGAGEVIACGEEAKSWERQQVIWKGKGGHPKRGMASSALANQHGRERNTEDPKKKTKSRKG